jgi:O-antigen/teichoic acid export membrane protein
MNLSSRKYTKNAISNLLSGGASALMAVALPHYFARDFRASEFSLWVLVLQLGAYVNFLNFGVQTAVGRYVSRALSKNDQMQAQEIVNAGFQILSLLGLVGIALLTIVGIMLPNIFHKIDPSMISTARFMLIWIGGALVLNLPTTTFLGVFVGHQRNDIPAVLALVTKGALAVALVFVAGATHDLRLCSQVYFVVTALGSILQYITFKRVCRGWTLHVFAASPAARRELISYCTSLTVWSVGMLLVNGLDTTIVGIFDFKSVAAYGICVSIVAFFMGIFNSITNPLLQIFSKIHAREEIDVLMRLLVLVSKVATLLLASIGCWMVLPVAPLFTVWVGSKLAAQAAPIFCVLVLANAVRSSSIPYAYYLLGAGLQRRVYLSPLAEGITNLLVSIIAAAKFGAIGVAIGTVAGAVVGVAANYFYNFRRTLPESFSIRKYFLQNLLYPLLLTSPMIMVILLARFFDISFAITIPAMALATSLPVLAAYRAYHSITKCVFQVRATT